MQLEDPLEDWLDRVGGFTGGLEDTDCSRTLDCRARNLTDLLQHLRINIASSCRQAALALLPISEE